VFGEGETVSNKVARGKAITYDVRLVNDGGEDDVFRLVGTGNAPGFRAVWKENGINVTAAITSGMFETDTLGPNGTTSLTLKVKVQAGAVVGSAYQGGVTAVSLDDEQRVDTVRAIVTAK
jgi:uncharacterized membrane protein